MSDHKTDAEKWHEGLHRLAGADTRFEMIEPLDMHIIPCTLPVEGMKPFLDLKAGRKFFTELASTTGDKVLENSSKSIVATLDAMAAKRRPKFREMVESVFGVAPELPTKDRLQEARERSEEAFFSAFPALGKRAYTEETIRTGLTSLGPEATYSADRVRQSVVAVGGVLNGHSRGRHLLPDFKIQEFEGPPILAAGVTTDDASNVIFGFNVNFDSAAMPGERNRLIIHEGVHVAQVGYLQALSKRNEISGSQLYVSPFTSTLVGLEIAAEGAIRFVPEIAGLDIASDPIINWRTLSHHAYMLEMLNIFDRMDSDTYTVDDAARDLDKWAPDYSNRQILELTFGLVDATIAGLLIGGSYALGAQYLDQALQHGNPVGKNMVLEAVRGPVTAPELAKLAQGQTLDAGTTLA